ncbi:hypothetical protein BBJ28_00014701 [Nothophytophthora sp. Chile5]|nr:hypothetical protein BBJ28_00014701 [Nothophytophthora sp. Chile5]
MASEDEAGIEGGRHMRMYGKRLNVNGKTYHPDCFCCTGCNRPLPSRFQVANGGCYHPECVPKSKPTRKVTTTTTVSGVPKQSQVQQENQSGNANGAGWNCPTCTFHNTNDASPTCGACDAIRVMECPTCKGEIKYVLLLLKILQRINVNGKAYHPDCFRCAACHGKFPTGKFQVKDGEFYHHECYKQLYHPRCDVCEGFIPYQPGTQKISFKVRYRRRFFTVWTKTLILISDLLVQIMPFWDLKYCAEHEDRDRCCSCQRIEVRTAPPTLSDSFLKHEAYSLFCVV